MTTLRNLGAAASALALLLGAACGKKAPVVESFVVDRTTVAAGDSVQFSWSVRDATKVEIQPEVGDVTGPGSSRTHAIQSPGTYTFTLVATGPGGTAQATVNVTATARVRAARINSFAASPSQIAPGQTTTLRWSVADATSVTIAASAGAAPGAQAPTATSVPVTPAADVVTYTLTAQGDAGSPPATATALVRVTALPSITSTFAASPSTILQGEQTTLTWDGTAAIWSVKDEATGAVTSLGPLKSLKVRPGSTRTYTLTGVGPTGNATSTATVTVTPNAGTTLSYTDPTVGAEKVKLVVAAGNGTSEITLQLVATQAVTARALALNLPLDPTKVQLAAVDGFTVQGFAPGTTGAIAAKAAIFESGPLAEVLSLGAAQKDNQDQSLAAGAVIATLKLSLRAGAGKGPVFEGATLASNPRYRSLIRAAAPASGTILPATPFAIGNLVVQ